MNETIKKYLPYLLAAVIAFVIYSVVYPNIDFLKNSEIKEKENQIELLEKEKTELLKSATQHKLNSEEYRKESEKYKNKSDSLVSKLEFRDRYILVMRNTLDSLDIDINIRDSALIKIDKEEYEILTNSTNSTINEHKQFFTDFIISQNNN